MTREDAYTILNISKDADKKAIRKAYAKLIKDVHPEENPNGFLQLHNAYKVTLSNLTCDTSSLKQENKPEEGLYIKENLIEFSFQQVYQQKLEEKIQIVIQRLEEIYEIVEFRRDPNNWSICFSMETFQSIKNNPEFIERYLEFIDKHRYLPIQIWNYLEQETDLFLLITKRMDKYRELYQYININFLSVPQIYYHTFEYLRSCIPLEILEIYIKNIILLQGFLGRREIKQALFIFYEAEKLISQDAELYKMMALYYFLNQHFDYAKQYCAKAIELDKNNLYFQELMYKIEKKE